MNPRKLAGAWLGLISVSSMISILFEDPIQAHSLSRSFKPFFDVFGRNIFFLTLNAIEKSMITIIPFSAFYLVLGMALSVLLTLLPRNNVGVIFTQGVIDTLSALPGLLIGLAISAIGNGSVLSIVVATMIMVFPHLIRFFESQIYHFKAQPFYASAEALGATPFHLSVRHLFPELFSLAVAIFPFVLSRLLYIETTLSFLGVGAISRTDHWGQLINQSREYLLEAPWLIIVSGIPLLLTLWSFHLLTHQESS